MAQAMLRAALGTGFPFLMTVLGAATVFFLRGGAHSRPETCMLGFAAGVMTAASVWSLLLPSIDQAGALRLPAWLPAAAGLALGALSMAGLDALTARLHRRQAEDTARQNALLMTAITLHNIPEGMAVGLAFALADGEGLAAAATLALGIGVQNFPEGAAVSLPQAGAGRGRAFAMGALSGAVEPLFGVLTVLAASGVRALMPWLLGLAAGAMLYVTASELLPRAGSRPGVWGFMAGFLLMMILDVSFGS